MNEPIETGCYSAPDPRTRFQKLRNKLFPSRHCFAPEAPDEFKDCIYGRAVTKLSWPDRLRVLLTGVVVTSWKTVTENEAGKVVSAATCHIGTAKDLTVVLIVLLLSSTCFAQDGYQLNTQSVPYIRYAERHEMNTPRLYSGNGTFLGELSSNRYAPSSISNSYGVYGSRYSPQSIRNPHGPYGIYSAQPIYVVPRNR